GPAGSSCARRGAGGGGFPSAARPGVAKAELVGEAAEAETEEPAHRDPIAIDVPDQAEAFEKAPDRPHAEREPARPQRLTDHQHADKFVLLFDEVAADGDEHAD